jgi:hypothetical protein
MLGITGRVRALPRRGVRSVAGASAGCKGPLLRLGPAAARIVGLVVERGTGGRLGGWNDLLHHGRRLDSQAGVCPS